MNNRLIRATLAFALASTLIVGCGSKDKPASGDTKKADSGSTSTGSDTSAGGAATTSSDGGFTVTLPEGYPAPTETTMPLDTKAGKLDMKVRTSAKGDEAIFMTAYVDYPDSAFAAGTDVMLDGAQQGAMTNLSGTVEHKEDITIDGNPGRSLTFKGTSGGKDMYGRVDYYLVKPRLYQMLFLTQKKELVEDESVKSAFSSFKLTK